MTNRKMTNRTMAKQKNKNGKSKKKRSVLYGTLQKHKNGYGFVDIGAKKEIFIPFEGINGAMDGDLVEIELLPEYLFSEYYAARRREAMIIGIKERAVKEVIGTFYRKKDYGFVVPEGRHSVDDIYVEKKNFAGAASGDKVVCTIISYPLRWESAIGKITEIISRKGSPGGDITALVRSCGVPVRFSQKVLDEADAVSSIPPAMELEGRRDLRHLTTFTIDGADARDFDDAVSISKKDNGNYLLGVHIADVSHYVREGSKLDREALNRGTSIYLPDRVIPMLPERLSNGICSLNPREDRLTLSCEMEIDDNGRIISHDIFESIICSKHRLVYEDITMLMDNDHTAMDREYMMGNHPISHKTDKHLSQMDDRQNSEKYKKQMKKLRQNSEKDKRQLEKLRQNSEKYKKQLEMLRQKYRDIYKDIMMMKDLAGLLERKRQIRGSIDFDLEESEIKLDNCGIPVEVGVAERGSANKMIEEFMLAANETVAEHFFHLDIPFIYRIHERPELTKMQELTPFLSGFGIGIEGGPGDVKPAQLAGILERIKGRPYENVVSTVLLRSMQKALYSPECKGHFGLALKYYCHFTSPIRRYPDLFIHRVIKEQLRGGLDQKRARSLTRKADTAADTSSFCERQAIELERDVMNLKKAEYMKHHIGEEYDGVISGVTSFGIFVQLENTIEGLVRYEDIGDDYYDLDQRHYCSIGRRWGRKFTLGDKVRIKVKSVDVDQHEVNFVFVKLL